MVVTFIPQIDNKICQTSLTI